VAIAFHRRFLNPKVPHIFHRPAVCDREGILVRLLFLVRWHSMGVACGDSRCIRLGGESCEKQSL
jgi:hypothetical protein